MARMTTKLGPNCSEKITALFSNAIYFAAAGLLSKLKNIYFVKNYYPIKHLRFLLWFERKCRNTCLKTGYIAFQCWFEQVFSPKP